MADADDSNKKKVSPIKLLVVGVISSIVFVAVAFLWLVVPLFSHVFIPSPWNAKMQEGENIWNSNRPKAEEQIGRAPRLNSSHLGTSHAVFCLKKKATTEPPIYPPLPQPPSSRPGPICTPR